MSTEPADLVEEGIVLRREGRSLVVVGLLPGEHCEGCGSHSLCHPDGQGRREIEAEDPFGTLIGERVRVAVPGSHVLRMSLLVYGLPLVLLLVGVAIGHELIPAGRWQDLGSFLLAATLTAAAFPLARWLTRRFGGKTPLHARIVGRATGSPAV